jgi:hypothetical protein
VNHGACPDHGHTCHGEAPCTLNTRVHLYGPLDVCAHCGEARPGTPTAAAVARAEYERAQNGYKWGLCSICGDANEPAFVTKDGKLIAVVPHGHDVANRLLDRAARLRDSIGRLKARRDALPLDSWGTSACWPLPGEVTPRASPIPPDVTAP